MELKYTTQRTVAIPFTVKLKHFTLEKLKSPTARETKMLFLLLTPFLFSSNFMKLSADRKSFKSTISAPSNNAVDKCTVIRAVAKDKDGSSAVSATYFIGTASQHIKGIAESLKNSSENSLAVISLTMNYEDLFDSKTGIYVKGDAFTASSEEYFKTTNRPDAEDARKLDANYRMKGREGTQCEH